MATKLCPKLQLAEMQTAGMVLAGLLPTEEMLEQYRTIEAEMYQLQVMIENHFKIRSCEVKKGD